jgi:hypothetical protein
VFRYAASRHPMSLLRADFVLCFAECLGVAAAAAGAVPEEGTGGVALSPERDVRSLYERSLAAVGAATAAYHGHLARTSVRRRRQRHTKKKAL